MLLKDFPSVFLCVELTGWTSTGGGLRHWRVGGWIEVIVSNILYGYLFSIGSSRAWSFLLIASSMVTSIALAAVALSEPTVSKKLVEVPIAGFHHPALL